MTAQAHTSQLTPQARARHAVEPLEPGVAGRNRVAAELALHDRLDRAADEDDPQRREPDLRAERGGRDQLARADDRGREHHAGTDAAQRLEEDDGGGSMASGDRT